MRQMRNKLLIRWTGVTALGGLSILAACLFVNSSYGLALMSPFVQIAFYSAYWGGGLAVIVGLAMMLRERMRR